MEIYHVRTGSEIPDISTGTTEIAWIKLKQGNAITDLASKIDALEEAIKSLKGAHGSTWGPTAEDPNEFAGIVNWDTKQVSVSVSSGIIMEINDSILYRRILMQLQRVLVRINSSWKPLDCPTSAFYM